MTANDLAGFIVDLHQELALTASQEGAERSLPEVFTEYMFDVLTEAGEIDGADVAMYEARAARASGFTLSEDESTLWLFLTDYRGGLDLQSYSKVHLDTAVRRMTGFLDQAAAGLWRQLEETSPAWDMAQRIAEAWSKVGEIRLVILTNAELTNLGAEAAFARVEARPPLGLGCDTTASARHEWSHPGSRSISTSSRCGDQPFRAWARRGIRDGTRRTSRCYRASSSPGSMRSTARGCSSSTFVRSCSPAGR